MSVEFRREIWTRVINVRTVRIVMVFTAVKRDAFLQGIISLTTYGETTGSYSIPQGLTFGHIRCGQSSQGSLASPELDQTLPDDTSLWIRSWMLQQCEIDKNVSKLLVPISVVISLGRGKITCGPESVYIFCLIIWFLVCDQIDMIHNLHFTV